MSPVISASFDSGNISVVDCDDAANIRLSINQDAQSDFLQWFHFRLSGLREQPCTLHIVNAGATTYPAGWEHFDVPTSTDRINWFRTRAQYADGVLSWTLTPTSDVVWFAYFAPYSLERHTDLLAKSAAQPGVSCERLGSTLDGRDLDCLHIGAHPNDGPSIQTDAAVARRQLWVIARQHPGESMTEWWMEGWLYRLLDEQDATSRALRRVADIHVVPNMNPDGSVRGHLRTNAAGANLNREWAEPSMERSPEVYLVRQRMIDTGVDLALDIHGDEALPYNFIAGTEGVADWDDRRDAALRAFKHTLASINPDFQVAHGYPRNSPGNANLSFCSNQVAHRFGCLAMTLEMPFKDTVDTPDPVCGWSPQRSARLGRSFVDAVYLQMTGRLLPAEDQ